MGVLTTEEQVVLSLRIWLTSVLEKKKTFPAVLTLGFSTLRCCGKPLCSYRRFSFGVGHCSSKVRVWIDVICPAPPPLPSLGEQFSARLSFSRRPKIHVRSGNFEKELVLVPDGFGSCSGEVLKAAVLEGKREGLKERNLNTGSTPRALPA
ncbi:hypothetical protein MHYP_G00224100 [Metynnis hypsauchen]